MKKLLTILICVLLSVSSAFAGGAKITASIYSGDGQVIATTSSQKPSTGWVSSGESVKTAGGLLYGGTVYAFANANQGSFFAGWYVNNNTTTLNTSNPYSVTSTWSSSASATVAAVFKPIIHVSTTSIGLVVNNGTVNPYTLTITVNDNANAKKLYAELSDTENFDIVDWPEGGKDVTSVNTHTLQIKYNGDISEAEGKTAQLTLRTDHDSNKNVVIPISVSAPPVIHFLGTKEEGDDAARGKYKVTFKNSDAPLEIGADGQNKTFFLGNEYDVTLTVTETNPDYIFFGWQRITKDAQGNIINVEYISKTNPYDGNLNMGDARYVKAEFIPKTTALFVVQGQSELYYDLQVAINKAEESTSKMVVFVGTNKNEVLSPRANDAAYTIPSGVTVLIPHNDKYKSEKPNDIEPKTNFVEYPTKGNGTMHPSEAANNYSKLSFAEKTVLKIQNGGKLCVGASLSATMPYNGAVLDYAWIEMHNGSKITAEGGSNLYAWGYITAYDKDKPDSEKYYIDTENKDYVGSVIAKTGAMISEVFQITDWRGGTATSNMVNNDKKVFPVNQYHIQNIEVPLTLEVGALENVYTAIDVTLLGIQETGVELISQNSSNTLFYIDQKTNLNTSILKYYSAENDRQNWIIKTEGDKPGNASMNNIEISMTVGLLQSVDIVSKNYVLPLTSNMTVRCENTNVLVPYDYAVLAGASIEIDDKSTLTINGNQSNPASLYIYDADENKSGKTGETNITNTGYFGSDEREILPVTYRPNGVKSRTITDAKLVVDGKLVVGEFGGMYTTKGKAEIISSILPASETKPEIELQSVSSKIETYQAVQGGSENKTVSYVSIPITSAYLYNKGYSTPDDYTATRGINATAENPAKFLYMAESEAKGRWVLPGKVNDNDWKNTSMKVTMPNEEFSMQVECYANLSGDMAVQAFDGDLEGDGFAFAKGDYANSVNYNAEKGCLEISLVYTSTDRHTSRTAKLTLTNVVGTKYPTDLTVNQDYTPAFTLSSLQEMPIQAQVGTSGTAQVNITWAENNVTQLTGTTNLLEWEYEIDPAVDGFAIEQIDKGKSVLVAYTATQGTKEANVKVTATYDGQVFDQSFKVAVTSFFGNNTLDFEENVPHEIYVDASNIAIPIKDKNNANPLVLSLEGENADELATFALKDGIPTITAKGKEGVVKAVVSQADDHTNGIAQKTIEHTITLIKHTPEVIWNWGIVYGGQTYNTPFANLPAGATWSLLKKVDADNLLDYNESDNSMSVVNISARKSASFLLNLEPTATHYGLAEQEYITQIYPNPRNLPLQLNSQAKYNIVASDITTGVETEEKEGDLNITLPVGASVTLNFIGIPGFIAMNVDGEGIKVEESSDGETWSEIVFGDGKWTFDVNQTKTNRVKLSNTGTSPIVISALSITIREGKQYTHYYGKADAIATAGGLVAAEGYYMSIVTTGSELINTQSAFGSTATAFSGFDDAFEMQVKELSFKFFAQSEAGYYFIDWTPVGQTMVAENTSIDPNFSPRIAANLMQRGYGYTEYEAMFCTGGACEDLPDDEKLAGILSFIPATHVGTWQANFGVASVISGNDINFGKVTSPNTSDKKTVTAEFIVNGDDINDFKEPVITGDGFSLVSTTKNVTAGKYSISVEYTPQNIAGTYNGTLTLERIDLDGQEASSVTIYLTAEEDYTPAFVLDSPLDFGSHDLGQETLKTIEPTEKNAIANMYETTWTAKVTEDEAGNIPSQEFTLQSINSKSGVAEVRYFRLQPGERVAYLHLTASYIDASSVEHSTTVVCQLTGRSTDVKTANDLAFKANLEVFVDDEAFDPFINRNNDNKGAITFILPADCGLADAGDGLLQPTGDYKTGTYTIKASQAASDQFEASEELTTTIVVRKHPTEITWNWDVLYFGGEYDNPITSNSDADWTLTLSNSANGMISYENGIAEVVIPQIIGEYIAEFQFSQEESDTHEAYPLTTFTTKMYSDPRHVRVDVNSQNTYDAVTVLQGTGSLVSYNASQQAIVFKDESPSVGADRQWVMHFLGVPDELSFKPSGNNLWQIEESSNGVNDWTVIYAYARIATQNNEAFSIALKPNSQYIRITYGSNSETPSDGVLKDVFVSALERVKCDVPALYMPIAADVENNPTKKTIKLTYISSEELTISTSDKLFTPSIQILPPSANADIYQEMPIEVTSKATTVKERISMFVKNKNGDMLFELPIESFVFPQTLPIRLATDAAKRFYFVTTYTQYAQWDAPTLILQNAPLGQSRYVTFEFTGAPSVIRFSHTAGENGEWIIEERATGESWMVADPSLLRHENGEIEQGLKQESSQVRVTYKGVTSDPVSINDLIIVGDASLTPSESTLHFSDKSPANQQNLVVTTVNLSDFITSIDNENFSVVALDKSQLENNTIADASITIQWNGNAVVDYGTLTFLHPTEDKVLATVELVGTRDAIDSPTTNIFTGVADGFTLNGTFEGTENREVLLADAFDQNDKALFDYLFIFGETSTMDGTKTITTPNNQAGSNAKTPCFIYRKSDSGDSYALVKMVENANDKSRIWEDGAMAIEEGVSLSVYVTGFCPYASTGYTKSDEGVFYFKGQKDATLDLYVQDAYIYSRYKTIDGHSFIGRDNGESFTEGYVRGSGAVFVFECTTENAIQNPFNVNIHTKDRNLLKSHYGCFFASAVGRAYQVSSPIQIHLSSASTAYATTLSFDDKWPTNVEDKNQHVRTNGFISLQKQVNNAPSIDLGSPNTIVNFNGGQVELQNAQIVSDNYKTTLAISYRSGYMSTFKMALGIGTDSKEGTVNFNDGTTTVIPMYVDEDYRQYYLMDEDDPTTTKDESAYTSCIRCPENTYVYGGSHSMMRACSEPTSKGGAPKTGPDGSALGLYQYPHTPEEGHKGGWSGPDTYGLVTPLQAPEGYKYESVTPNDNGTPDDLTDDYLNFWVPAGYDTNAAQPEVDQTISYWKACMTEIRAEYAGSGGGAGGDQRIKMQDGQQIELVYNLMYCQIDERIRQIIAAHDGTKYTYTAPIKNPATGEYMSIPPSVVGGQYQHYVTNGEAYTVENKIYYVTLLEADNWMAFTAPFDVEKIYVMETYSEEALSKIEASEEEGLRKTIMNVQAKHNADFAAFFAVTVALGSDKPFDEIYKGYIEWGKSQDIQNGLYENASGKAYDLRGQKPLINYDGKNWRDANYYLYHNAGDWVATQVNGKASFEPKWEFVNVPNDGEVLLQKGHTYSLMFPYCVGCEDGRDEMWDYWSGKFVIFESTTGKHIVEGQMPSLSTELNPNVGMLGGNATFNKFNVSKDVDNFYEYFTGMQGAGFYPPTGDVTVEPTFSYLLADVTAPAGQKITGIRRTGEIIYGDDNNGNQNGTSGHIPTVGGGHDLFITSIEGGINVAVAAPQYVRVLSSTGSVIYSGMIQTALDIQLPSLGMYVVSGEKEVQKVMY